MKMIIEPIGTSEFPRFIISNDQGEVHDGNGWNSDRGRAMLYIQGQVMAVQFNALQEQLFEAYPLYHFVVPMRIKVRSAEPFTQKELEMYLEQVISILIDQEQGTGPTANSLVRLSVTWREMRSQP